MGIFNSVCHWISGNIAASIAGTLIAGLFAVLSLRIKQGFDLRREDRTTNLLKLQELGRAVDQYCGAIARFWRSKAWRFEEKRSATDKEFESEKLLGSEADRLEQEATHLVRDYCPQNRSFLAALVNCWAWQYAVTMDGTTTNPRVIIANTTKSIDEMEHLRLAFQDALGKAISAERKR